MHSEQPPFTNTALVADNDRMFHRIASVGDSQSEPNTFPTTARIEHREADQWRVVDGTRSLARFADREVRTSILWKAQIRVPGPDEVPPLDAATVAETLFRDLTARMIDAPRPDNPLTDEHWIALVHDTYYRCPHAPEPDARTELR